MQRNPFDYARQHADRAAQRAVTAARPTPAQTGSDSSVTVGAVDSTTGEWKPFGQLGITTFGEGFRVAG